MLFRLSVNTLSLGCNLALKKYTTFSHTSKPFVNIEKRLDRVKLESTKRGQIFLLHVIVYEFCSSLFISFDMYIFRFLIELLIFSFFTFHFN